MYTSPRITRDEFLNSHFLKITVLEIEKSLLRHNVHQDSWSVLFWKSSQIATNRLQRKSLVKLWDLVKKYFCDKQIQQKQGLKDLAIENHLRNSKQFEQIELLFKKLNSGYLCGGPEGQQSMRGQIRNSLYNLLFSNIEQLPSSSEEDIPNNSPVLKPKPAIDITALVAPIKEKQDECF